MHGSRNTQTKTARTRQKTANRRFFFDPKALGVNQKQTRKKLRIMLQVDGVTSSLCCPNEGDGEVQRFAWLISRPCPDTGQLDSVYRAAEVSTRLALGHGVGR